jgi:hypothetical protein
MVISKNISSKYGDFVLFYFWAKILHKNHIGFLFGSHNAKIRLKVKQNTMKHLDSISLKF